MTAFDKLGLLAELTRAVAEEGYTEPTPVQLSAIPIILEGRDVLAGAQTGTGKTAGFTLPMLQRLLASRPAKPGQKTIRALILTPTRELAAQVEESVRIYGKYVPLRSTLIYGGVSIVPQIEALRRGVDILVATPGRLLDHVGQRTLDLSHVEILVLDEADRMLDMGFIRDIRKILALLPTRRQNLLFSATFSEEIRSLAGGVLKNPASVDVARRNAESELVLQRVHPVDQSRKRDLLAHLISTGNWQQVLVFTRTKHGANRLAAQLLRSGIEAAPIHGNKSQSARTKALADFKAGRVRVLVATDIAARGLDIEQLPHVVNYELPNVPEDYVHRIGRTGRAGCEGEAIALVSADERVFLADIEKLMRRKIDQEVIPGFEPGTGSARPSSDPEDHDRDRNRGGNNRNRPPRRADSSRPASREPSRSRGDDSRSSRSRPHHATSPGSSQSQGQAERKPQPAAQAAKPATPSILQPRRTLVPPPSRSIRYMP